MSDEKTKRLPQEEDIVYFKGGLCLYSHESYTFEERREICNQIMTSSKAITDAICVDFKDRCGMTSSPASGPAVQGFQGWLRQTRTHARQGICGGPRSASRLRART